MLAKRPTGSAPISAPTGSMDPTHDPSSVVMVNMVVALAALVALGVVLLTEATMNSRAGPVHANAVPAQNALSVAANSISHNKKLHHVQ